MWINDVGYTLFLTLALPYVASAAGKSNVSAPTKPYIVDSAKDLIHDTVVSIEQMERLNNKIAPMIQKLARDRYFSVYKVDLSPNRCPFTDDNGLCGSIACAIETTDEELPEEFRPQYLGKLRQDSVSTEAPSDSLEGCAPEERSIYAYRGRTVGSHDYCYPEDESDEGGGVWVDLRDNAERFTGYAGPGAHKLWRAVYQENCFGYYGDDWEVESGSSLAQPHAALGGSDVSALGALFSESLDNRHARQELGERESFAALNRDSQCVEQRLFYRLLSGMHASISTHLTFDWLNTTSGNWGPNTGMFLDRVGSHEDRVNHLFFNYVLVSRAMAKLDNYFSLLSFSASCESVDLGVRYPLQKLCRKLAQGPRGINETQLFMTPEGAALKDEFRSRVRNVNALMSCVGCERCRLWGKLQTAGYGTALKILFELPEKPEDNPVAVREVLSEFRRSELVALLNTFARLSHSVKSVGYFRRRVMRDLNLHRSWSYQMEMMMEEFKQAVGFVLQSYLDFPKNLWHIALYYSNMYWNKFVGRPVSAPISGKIDL